MRKSTGWTPERRARQAEMIRKWKPWEKSTGPKTESGKAAAAKNADKGGYWKVIREQSKLLNQLLREHRDLLEIIEE
ncbi:hypothetical protein FGF68_04145 [Prosthecochloris vibrioformis]|uniref:Uncharacterized protein n=1 Tax=Prosthecochloris vibrioformis TaxID=1098 RepID=A0A5C4S2K3_PROVB|nr:hypothetical protein FGF68_04145 [Prosthecochloris vibrioformis]